MDGEHLADLLTEVALHFEHQPADFACLIIGHDWQRRTGHLLEVTFQFFGGVSFGSR